MGPLATNGSNGGPVSDDAIKVSRHFIYKSESNQTQQRKQSFSHDNDGSMLKRTVESGRAEFL